MTTKIKGDLPYIYFIIITIGATVSTTLYLQISGIILAALFLIQLKVKNSFLGVLLGGLTTVLTLLFFVIVISNLLQFNGVNQGFFALLTGGGIFTVLNTLAAKEILSTSLLMK